MESWNVNIVWHQVVADFKFYCFWEDIWTSHCWLNLTALTQGHLEHRDVLIGSLETHFFPVWLTEVPGGPRADKASRPDLWHQCSSCGAPADLLSAFPCCVFLSLPLRWAGHSPYISMIFNVLLFHTASAPIRNQLRLSLYFL